LSLLFDIFHICIDLCHITFNLWDLDLSDLYAGGYGYDPPKWFGEEDNFSLVTLMTTSTSSGSICL
ncbi:hypothetical protein ACJX0J_019012, partial [Zea mays]